MEAHERFSSSTVKVSFIFTILGSNTYYIVSLLKEAYSNLLIIYSNKIKNSKLYKTII
jgi:hypothetical protein